MIGACCGPVLAGNGASEYRLEEREPGRWYLSEERLLPPLLAPSFLSLGAGFSMVPTKVQSLLAIVEGTLEDATARLKAFQQAREVEDVRRDLLEKIAVLPCFSEEEREALVERMLTGAQEKAAQAEAAFRAYQAGTSMLPKARALRPVSSTVAPFPSTLKRPPRD